MINLFGNAVNSDVIVGCSGGVDSMFAAHFLAQKRYRNVHLLFVHHRTEDSEKAMNFLSKHALDETGAKSFRVEYIEAEAPDSSKEDFWREQRYNIFKAQELQVVTAHHLDDCMETYLFGALNGTPKVIPYQHKNVVRPFLLTRKSQMVDWCKRKNVKWVEDSSNQDTKYMRNRIRHSLMPEALAVNPGLHKVVARKVQAESIPYSTL